MGSWVKKIGQENQITSVVLKIKLANKKEKETKKRSMIRTTHRETNLLVYRKIKDSIMLQTYEINDKSVLLIASMMLKISSFSKLLPEGRHTPH